MYLCVCACYTISTYKYKVNVNIRKLQVHQMQYTCMYDHVCIMDYYGYMLVRPYIRSLSCLLRGVSENGGTPRIQLNGVSDANPWNLVATQFSEKPQKKTFWSGHVWAVVTYCGRWTLFPSQNPRARASSRRGKMVTVTALLMGHGSFWGKTSKIRQSFMAVSQNDHDLITMAVQDVSSI